MKEEEGGCSSQKRRAGWESLQPDLVHLVADCVLSTGGVDEYMSMRAVCPTWRSAVAKPSPHAAVADLRFRPRQWVLLNGADDDQGRPLFLHVTTGRFRRLRLSLLHDYILVGASDGLLVLGDRERPHAARLLNPLTGDMLPFAAPIPPGSRVATTIALAGSEPTIIFSFPQILCKYVLLGGNNAVVYSADPMGQLCAVKIHDAALKEEESFCLRSMVTCAGNVYVLSLTGMLYKIVWTGGLWYAERILEIEMHYTGALVESAGKLLVVRVDLGITEFFSVDVERKVLEPLESIGSCALFLSFGRCMLVDADKVPSIKGNCTYGSFGGNKFYNMYTRYDLSDAKKENITGPQVPGYLSCLIADSDIIREGPLSLAQVLLTPCPDVKAQLDRIRCKI
ncbi:hypothetical protein CFC21_044562 [Triticum aestivum]|uniref:KIB1-4 beta-propeller domain-containing protein n=2 Tax=Triticum aestivum TaxID=4565 RepID=A0A3B6G1W9_WHEAT|nr:hypothetical protein CFC21_044562 [Triticum aestivum]